MNSMTHQERIEFEQELREEARIEARIEAAYEYAMYEDVDFASQHLQSELDQTWIDTYKYLRKECDKYGVDFQELLDNL
jgi:hypothetical protein